MEAELPRDFKEFLRLLRSHGVEYLLIGGYAVIYHGFPRATGDMDIWIAMDPENARRMVDTVREFGFDTPDLSPALFLQDDSMVRMGNVPLRIEILTRISGVGFDECYHNRVVDEMDGVEVSVISLRDLLANKRASGRHKDLMDIEELSGGDPVT
jgi:predicted nucleotidyltransferase